MIDFQQLVKHKRLDMSGMSRWSAGGEAGLDLKGCKMQMGGMAIEVVTKDDLVSFRQLLVNDIRGLLAEQSGKQVEPIDGYRTKDVRRILGCCVNKLMSLMAARKIRVKKVGGTVYYNKEDVKRLLAEGFK